MSYIRTMNRRHFLAGSGFLLAAPTLGSLLPRTARAQVMRQKRFVLIASDHGGVFPENFFPELPSGAASTVLFPAVDRTPEHTVQWAPLTASFGGGNATLSNTLEAPTTVLNEALISKMNVIAGLDISTYLAHHRGLLGNFGAADEGINVPMMATIDQLMANSPGFNVQTTRQKSMHFALGYGSGSSLRQAFSADRVGNSLVPVQAERELDVLWERLFEGAAPPPRSQTLVVDRVLEHYQSLRNGAFGDASRLSSADQQRLDTHMERLFELQRKLTVTVDCGQPGRPSGGFERQQLADAVEIYAIALACSACHIGVISLAAEQLSQDGGWNNWHEQIAHNGGGSRRGHNPNFQRINYRAQREVFEHGFLQLAQRLNVDQGDGTTVLDDSLVMWTMESGETTHGNVSTPVVTAGSAGGWFNTGRFLDYRNYANTFMVNADHPARWPGTLYNRFLTNVLQSVGVTAEEWHAEFQRAQPDEYARGIRGFGAFDYEDNERRAWPEIHYRAADEPLPFLAAGA